MNRSSDLTLELPISSLSNQMNLFVILFLFSETFLFLFFYELQDPR